MASFKYRDSISRISEIPITANTLYILDIDDTLLRDDSRDKRQQVLNDEHTNAWLASVRKKQNSSFYVCTYRNESADKWTRAQFRSMGITELRDAFIDYTTDKGDSIDNIVAAAVDSVGISPWTRFVFVDDNPQAHYQMSRSRTYSVNPSGFALYMIDPYDGNNAE